MMCPSGLLKGEHIGLVGANGEGKVYFLEHCDWKTDAG